MKIALVASERWLRWRLLDIGQLLNYLHQQGHTAILLGLNQSGKVPLDSPCELMPLPYRRFVWMYGFYLRELKEQLDITGVDLIHVLDQRLLEPAVNLASDLNVQLVVSFWEASKVGSLKSLTLPADSGQTVLTVSDHASENQMRERFGDIFDVYGLDMGPGDVLCEKTRMNAMVWYQEQVALSSRTDAANDPSSLNKEKSLDGTSNDFTVSRPHKTDEPGQADDLKTLSEFEQVSEQDQSDYAYSLVIVHSAALSDTFRNSLKAVCQIVERFPGLRVFIYTDDRYASQAWRWAKKLGLGDAVQLVEARREYVELMLCADLMLHTDQSTDSRPIIRHAMRRGVCVLSTEQRPTWLKHRENMWFIDQDHEKAWLTAIHDLLNDQNKRSRLSDQARKTHLLDHGDAGFVEDAYALYEKMTSPTVVKLNENLTKIA